MNLTGKVLNSLLLVKRSSFHSFSVLCLLMNNADAFLFVLILRSCEKQIKINRPAVLRD